MPQESRVFLGHFKLLFAFIWITLVVNIFIWIVTAHIFYRGVSCNEPQNITRRQIIYSPISGFFFLFFYRLIFNILIFKWSSLFMHIFVALVMKNFNRHCLNSGNFLWKRRRVIIKWKFVHDNIVIICHKTKKFYPWKVSPPFSSIKHFMWDFVVRPKCTLSKWTNCNLQTKMNKNGIMNFYCFLIAAKRCRLRFGII